MNPFQPVEYTLAAIADECPWSRDYNNNDDPPHNTLSDSWAGRFVYVDKYTDEPLDEKILPEHVARVLALVPGSFTVLLQLHDGRYMSWESWQEMTGSGFHGDAYGGHQEVWVASTPQTAIAMISEQERERLVFATRPEDEGLTLVLYDLFMQADLAPHHDWESNKRDRSFHESVEVARQSGEFGDLVSERVWELWLRWERERAKTYHYCGHRGCQGGCND